ncbi:hypothetical protein LR48_Vigan02g175200 [Vigna angularis]|uniref:DUF7963 domain-containing protein n=2 Tax=Phaseolus angularis TaxID=3914 RepID=A0A0L9TYY2_PHAAN|nr:uncharacterized protein LOC108324238 [Vigna angularis]XP_052731503.1 uncharacterized protein LOC108324238 [Vigna angularis]KOM35602.1 hypothetical protein LR48_Vigan02g175200 [Vigna angularis]BAT94826.1 hypothetical protein VIGAN_08146900 [Vigna angularis var. angularis]
MASTIAPAMPSTSTDPDPDAAVRAVRKRYEGLLTVRTRAIKGKGAWYWAHLEPTLLGNAVKLKCSLCDSLFSASNPSRTASEHLKRGTCPNFNHSSLPSPSPISTVLSHSNNGRKRTSSSASPNQDRSVQHLMLSGGKDDLCALAVFEDSVKKLKSPRNLSHVAPPELTQDQVNSAVELLADWFYESCGSVPLSSLEHPKFQSFLTQLGLPVTLLRREIYCSRLEDRFGAVKAESEARIRDALFFQVGCDGWKGEDGVAKFIVNLPNGTSVFHKVVLGGEVVSSKYAEEILWEVVKGVCGSDVQRCVGIVADRFKGKALRNLEVQNHWMVNVACQVQGFTGLIKDFSNNLPLFRVVTENSLKVANFINTESQVRGSFLRYRMQELECAGLVRVPSPKFDVLKDFTSVFPMLEDILRCAAVIQMVVMEDAFKVACMEDPLAREIAGIVQSEGFWNELEAVYSLVKLIRGVVQDIEAERPLVGRCLPLWEEVRTKVKEWCVKYSIVVEPVEEILENRFRKNYHPAWSAAFILDPLYLIKDSCGKYLPPFKCLTREQEKDVDKLLTRLASREEAHVVLMELMKWRSEGLDPLYAQAVQMKQQDPITGKMKVANPLSSRLVWETCLSEFKSLRKLAVRLIFLHATSCGFKSNYSFIRKLSAQKHSRISLERAQKMIYVAAHAKLERRDFSNEEEKEAELLAMESSDDGMLAVVFADTPLIGGIA